MRRKLAYIFLTAAILFGTAATLGTTLTSLDTDVTYGAGKDIYFRISEKGTTSNGVFPDNYIANDNYDAVNAVGSEMEARLKTWGVNASVSKEGYDTVKVSIRSQQADATEYNYIENYLAFSGGHITVTAGTSVASVQEEADKTYLGDKYINNAMFKGQTATIEYVNNVPVVKVPVNYTGKEGELGKLITFCTSNTKAADSSAGTAATNCYVVLWANRQEGDTYAAAYDSKSSDYDANVAKRLIFGENATNAWFDETDDDNDYKSFQLLPNSEALTENGYDSTKSGAAYKAAFYYLNLMNASDYGTILGSDKGVDVNFAYAIDSVASVEGLVSAGAWHLSPAWNASLIACLVAVAIAAIVLSLYYHLGVLAILANAAVGVMGTLLLFVYFNAQFGVGSLLGLALVALGTAFGGVYYFAKVKEGLYAGKSAKKAHADAVKKALWPSIDEGIASIVIGLCVYGFIPSVTGQLGLALVLGGFFGTLSNIVLLRLQGWLLANDNDVEEHPGSAYAVEETKLPNLLKEEKQTYFGPYAETKFGNGKKPAAIALAVLSLASIIGISVFSATTSSAYNYAGAYADSTSLAVEYRVVKDSNTILLLGDKTKLQTNFLGKIDVDGTSLGSLSGQVDTTTGTVYDTLEEKTYTVYYYNVALTKAFDLTKNDYAFTYSFNTTPVTQTTNFQDGINEAITLYAGNSVTISAQNVVAQAGVPSVGTVYLALGVSLASLLIYFMLRHKPARGITLTLSAGFSGLLVVGFFTLTRIPATPLVSMGAIAATFLAFLLGSFLLGKEKEIVKESREKDKTTFAFQTACLEKANSEGAGDVVVYSLLTSAVFIAFWALAPMTWSYIFLGSFFGFLVAVALTLVLFVPAIEEAMKLLSKIHISFHPFRKDNGNLPTQSGKKKTSEPEEATFIGIND